MHAMARAGLVADVGAVDTGACGSKPRLWEWQA